MSGVARVSGLRTYPVKSMAARVLSSVELTAAGLAGDRVWAVVDPDGAPVRSREAPGLAAVEVGLTDAADGADEAGEAGDADHAGAPPALVLPGGVDPGTDVDLALSAYLGRPVRLVAADGARRRGAAVHLVSRQAVAADLGVTVDDPACAAATPRANLLLDLGDDSGDDSGDGFERAWVGRQVAVGDAVLEVTRAPRHCLGVYAEVVTPGRVNLGDAVRPRR